MYQFYTMIGYVEVLLRNLVKRKDISIGCKDDSNLNHKCVFYFVDN